MNHTFEIDEGQRQMLVLAVAHLAVERPGWDYALQNIARVFHAEEMYQEFKELAPRSGNPHSQKACTHAGYSFKKHGQHCPHCSKFLTDSGD